MQEQALLQGLQVLNVQTIDSIRQLAGNSAQTLIAKLVKIFVEDSPKKISAILQAIRNSDAKALFEAAHNLRSSCANLGAERLSKLCEFLEFQGRAGTIPDLFWSRNQLEVEYQEAAEQLRSLVPKTEDQPCESFA